MEQGSVKWFDDQKGYGFVEQDVGDDLFVHYSDIQQEGYKTLSENQVVEFEIEETEKGLAAKNVSIVSEQSEEDEAEAEVDDESEDFGDSGFGDDDFGADDDFEAQEEETESFGIDEEI